MKTKYIVMIGLLWGLCNAAWADLNTDLQNAAEEGDIDAIQLLINQGAIIETQDEDGNTPLKNAVRANQLEAVKTLVEAGADVNTRSNKGTVPLNAAAKKGYLYIVKYLLKHNADINARGKSGNTSLKLAVMRDRVRVVEELIKAGADVDIRAKNDATALISAAKDTSMPLVQMLIAAGADPSYRSDNGYTALTYAYADEFSSGHMQDVLKNHNMAIGEYLSAKSNEITEEAFQKGAKQAFANSRWSVVDFSPGKVSGVLKRGSRAYKAIISFDGQEILVRFLQGYGSNKIGYFGKLVRHVTKQLGLKRSRKRQRNFIVFLALGNVAIAEDQFYSLGAAAMKSRGWTVTDQRDLTIYAEIARSGMDNDSRYRCEMTYGDGEVLVRYVDGYGSKNPSYLRNIQIDLGASLGLKRTR